jgi:hypothetical protein
MFDSTPEFDEGLGMLFHRLGRRRDEGRLKLRAVMKMLLGDRGESVQVELAKQVRTHNQWNASQCVPLIDDWVIVFSSETVSSKEGRLDSRIHLLAVECEPERHP